MGQVESLNKGRSSHPHWEFTLKYRKVICKSLLALSLVGLWTVNGPRLQKIRLLYIYIYIHKSIFNTIWFKPNLFVKHCRTVWPIYIYISVAEVKLPNCHWVKQIYECIYAECQKYPPGALFFFFFLLRIIHIHPLATYK